MLIFGLGVRELDRGGRIIQRVTDRAAVEAAMDEFDRLGRDEFLRKYGFGSANRYFVKRNGQRYDSKAIYGYAHQIQYPEHGPVQSADFSDGHQQIQNPLEALGFNFEDLESEKEQIIARDVVPAITASDVNHIINSRAKKRYAELSLEEQKAYVRVSEALKALGDLLKSKLPNPDEFEVRTTAGFNVTSGVRSYIPKDLWFSVSPRDNAQALAGMPQLFMIVSERGIEYGFGASVAPSDFSQKSVKNIVRDAAPIIFENLPSPDSPEAALLESKLESSGSWLFRRKHRLQPRHQDFQSFKEWLRFLKSPEGKRKAAGTISRYVIPQDTESVSLPEEIEEMALLFEPLLDRDWTTEKDTAAADNARPHETNEIGTMEFANRLSSFLTEFDHRRAEAFSIDDGLGAAMRKLQDWLEQVPAVRARPTIKVKISVGQGGWTKTPWIALLDGRETTSAQRGTYIVFLIAEDLSVTYLTMNQGMTELRNRLGQPGAVKEMLRFADATRPMVSELRAAGFAFDNCIDLHSKTDTAKNYEIGTIVNVPLLADALPDDATVERHLSALLSAYDKIIDANQASEDELQNPEPPELDPPLAAPYGIEDALRELFLEREDVEKYLDIWTNKKNLILQGAPGVGKSFIARRLAYALIGSKDDRKVQTVQFHQSYSYEDFVQGYRPDGDNGFVRKNGTFYEFRDRALDDPDGTYVFIIDEINRGNLSKIFGELMLLIEHDKRGPAWRTRLAYADDGEPDFHVPENLFLLGMMNTADRSLSLVDYALRRRFAFLNMQPLYDAPKFLAHLEAHGVSTEVINRIVNGMAELNQAIENDRINLGPGFRIGHSFFTPTGPIPESKTWYRRIVETEIHPLLEEYWFDAPENADQWRDQLLR